MNREGTAVEPIHRPASETPQANYAQRAVDAANTAMPYEDPDLIRLYTLLALTKGTDTTMRDVHDAWALWEMTSRPDHPSIVPFDELEERIQEYDRPYMEAIRRVARILDGEAGGG